MPWPELAWLLDGRLQRDIGEIKIVIDGYRSDKAARASWVAAEPEDKGMAHTRTMKDRLDQEEDRAALDGTSDLHDEINQAIRWYGVVVASNDPLLASVKPQARLKRAAAGHREWVGMASRICARTSPIRTRGSPATNGRLTLVTKRRPGPVETCPGGSKRAISCRESALATSATVSCASNTGQMGTDKASDGAGSEVSMCQAQDRPLPVQCRREIANGCSGRVARVGQGAGFRAKRPLEWLRSGNDVRQLLSGNAGSPCSPKADLGKPGIGDGQLPAPTRKGRPRPEAARH